MESAVESAVKIAFRNFERTRFWMIDDSASSGFSQDTQPASESEASFHRFSQASIPAACVRRSLLQNRWRPMARRRRAERVICFGSDTTQRRSTLAKICEDHQYERFQRSNCTIFCLKKPYNFSCPMFQEDQVDAASDAVKAEFDRLGKNWDFAKEAPGGSLVWRFGGLDFLVESVSMSSWRAEDCWKKVDLNVGSSGWAREILDKDGQQKLWDDLCFGYLDYLDYDVTALNIQSGCHLFQKISHQMTFWAAPQSRVRTRPACSWAKVMFPKWTT